MIIEEKIVVSLQEGPKEERKKITQFGSAHRCTGAGCRDDKKGADTTPVVAEEDKAAAAKMCSSAALQAISAWFSLAP